MKPKPSEFLSLSLFILAAWILCALSNRWGWIITGIGGAAILGILGGLFGWIL